MSVSLLPFGRTGITAQEYIELIDIGGAVQHLSQYTDSDAAASVQRFAHALPSLLRWLEREGREYPWRQTTDPWRVYVSEVLLQRTRGDAVADQYHAFFDRFPGPEAVQKADENEIRAFVRPLGFVNQRTRSLQSIADHCVKNHGGSVPADLTALKQPWRVGPYSARACLLFAYETPIALVDANIARIVERVFDYEMPQQPHKSDHVYEFVETLVPDDAGAARAFTLALLDLGALVCTPNSPACPICPLSSACVFTRL